MMLLTIADEFDATGAAAMFWFHGFPDGKSCWPRSVSSSRAYSGTTPGKARRLDASRDDWPGEDERREVLAMVDPIGGTAMASPFGSGRGPDKVSSRGVPRHFPAGR